MILPLKEVEGEHDVSSSDVSPSDRLRRYNVERVRDGGEEGEGRKQNELHDWGVTRKRERR